LIKIANVLKWGPKSQKKVKLKLHIKNYRGPSDVSSIGACRPIFFMDFFTSWKMNDNGMKKEEREETPLQEKDESRRNSPL